MLESNFALVLSRDKQAETGPSGVTGTSAQGRVGLVSNLGSVGVFTPEENYSV